MPIPETPNPTVGDEATTSKAATPHHGFSFEKKLGSGAFGKVYRVRCQKTLEKRAMKIMKNRTEIEKEVNSDEIYLLRRLAERGFDEFNLLKFYTSFTSISHVQIVTELLDLDLFSYLFEQRKRPLDVESVRKIGYQVLNGIKHLNRFGYAHTDLKLENIMLVDRNGADPLAIKLIDFGCAQSLSWLKLLGQGKNMTTVGYRSPEVTFGCPLNEKLDIWAIGIIICELYTGFPLFTADDQCQLIKQIDAIVGLNEYIKDGDYYEDYVENVQVKVDGVLTEKYNVLMPSTEMPQLYYKQKGFKKLHKFGLNSREGGGATKEDRQLAHLVHRMIAINPDERISAEDALQHVFMNKQSSSPGPVRTHRSPVTKPASPYSITKGEGLKMKFKVIK